jgi:hypothetical protein
MAVSWFLWWWVLVKWVWSWYLWMQEIFCSLLALLRMISSRE